MIEPHLYPCFAYMLRVRMAPATTITNQVVTIGVFAVGVYVTPLAAVPIKTTFAPPVNVYAAAPCTYTVIWKHVPAGIVASWCVKVTDPVPLSALPIQREDIVGLFNMSLPISNVFAPAPNVLGVTAPSGLAPSLLGQRANWPSPLRVSWFNPLLFFEKKFAIRQIKVQTKCVGWEYTFYSNLTTRQISNLLGLNLHLDL
jgi:hypothetical protein